MIAKSFQKVLVTALAMASIVLLLAAQALPVSAAGVPAVRIPENTVTATLVNYANKTSYPNPTSYMKIALSGVGAGNDVSNTTYYGWCIQDNGKFSSPLPVNLYSSYDPLLPERMYNPLGAPIPWGKVNWVLNNKPAHWWVTQDVIWLLAWGNSSWSATMPAADQKAAQDLLAAANDHADFVPQPGQVMAVVLYTADASDQDSIIEVTVPPPATLGGVTWNDQNGNGIRDTGEPSVPNVAVTLYDSASQASLGSTTADANGQYRFGALAQGSYHVRFTAPSGYAFTRQNAGSNTAIDSNADISGKTTDILLASGQTESSVDAGLYRPAALGDLFWLDLNANGVQDAGEPGLPNATVSLYQSGSTTALVSLTTDANGRYLFTNLAPGSYNVQFTAPVGFGFGPRSAGSNPAVDSNVDAFGKTAAITLASGQSHLSVDAGVHLATLAPTGRIMPTGTTCSQFARGAGADLTLMQYSVKANQINQLNPGVFLYYSKITAPATSFTIDVKQANTNSWGTLEVQSIGQIVLYDATCTKTKGQGTATFNTATGTAAISVRGATAGATYYVGIKYSHEALLKTKVTTPYPTTTYRYVTYVNGAMQIASWDSLNISPKAAGSSTTSSKGDRDDGSCDVESDEREDHSDKSDRSDRSDGSDRSDHDAGKNRPKDRS